MNVRVMTPTEVILECEAKHVTIEDPTGSLGFRPGHAPLVTPLVQGIVTVRERSGNEKYVAVNGGVAIVNEDSVEIATRQAVIGEDVDHLEETALKAFEKENEGEKTNHVAFEKLRISFMRNVLDLDRAGEKL